MPTFSSLDQFKDHKQYVLLLKKALLTVKPDLQKKFLYFKQYPFGPKKLPLVLADFDPGCPTVLAKAGHKPTDEGLVSLTPKDELNFEAKKGNLKRIRIKKYFDTMGGGIKPVFVPPGETDEEAEGAEPETPGETGVPITDPAKVAAEDLTKFMTRFKELQPDVLNALKAAGPSAQELKLKATEAGALAAKKDFTQANRRLNEIQALLFDAALQNWTPVRAAAVEQLRQLSMAFKELKDPSADRGIMLLQAIIKNLTERPATRQQVLELERYLETDDIIPEAELPNPFGFTVSVRDPLLKAVTTLKKHAA